jgi:hypothetical protein
MDRMTGRVGLTVGGDDAGLVILDGMANVLAT